MIAHEIARLARRVLRLTVFASLALAPLPLSAQQTSEPLLEALRSRFQTDALRVEGLIQAVVDPSVDPDDPDPANVQVAAMRLRLIGRLDGGFEYFFQTNFAASPSILDARVGWSSSPAFKVHAGRFKTPLSREFLTYAGSIDFVNRSRVVGALVPNRQTGVQLSGTRGELAWTLGGFTGSDGRHRDESLLGVARVELSPAVGSEGGTRLRVAASGALGRDGAIGTGVFGRNFSGDGGILALDARVESGRLMLSGEVLRADWDPVGAADTDASGFFGTVGWMTTPKTQLLARWDRFRAPEADTDDVIVLGFNAWPTGASEIQVNWVVPTGGSSSPHKLLVNFQVGF